MRRRSALIAAVLVLAGGAGMALVFHKPSAPGGVEQHRDHDGTGHRDEEHPRYLMEVRSAPPSPTIEPEAPAAVTPHASTPDRINGLPLFEAGDSSPPKFADRYGDPPQPIRPTRHEVTDGDTLPALAARYLGDAGRAPEIFTANRDVLTHPDLLPIGLTLKLPPR